MGCLLPVMKCSKTEIAKHIPEVYPFSRYTALRYFKCVSALRMRNKILEISNLKDLVIYTVSKRCIAYGRFTYNGEYTYFKFGMPLYKVQEMGYAWHPQW